MGACDIVHCPVLHQTVSEQSSLVSVNVGTVKSRVGKSGLLVSSLQSLRVIPYWPMLSTLP